MTITEALAVAKEFGWTVTKTPAPTGSSTEEAMRQLRAAGYSIEPPNTSQRKTLVEGANNVQRTAPQRANSKIYRHGDYLREKLQNTPWDELADRSRPLPQGVSASLLVKEFGELLAGQIEERYII